MYLVSTDGVQCTVYNEISSDIFVSEFQVTMIDAKGYTKVNNASQESVACLINEFEDKLINIFGKCMDVGCGPGDITRNILLPALDPKAIMIGKKMSM